MEYNENRATEKETVSVANGSDTATEQEYRGKAANALHQSAEKAREWGSEAPGGSRTSEWGRQASESLDNASDYLRDHSVDQITRDFTNWTRQHPTPALLCALAVGFLFGRAVRS